MTTNQADINQIQQEAQVKPAAKSRNCSKVTDQEAVIQNTRGTTTEEKMKLNKHYRMQKHKQSKLLMLLNQMPMLKM